MTMEHEIEFRVRYQETDAQGRVHHATYLTYFEMGRTELLRAAGWSYRELEASGTMLVVAEIGCQYYLPAFYDDLLQLRTRTVRAKGARMEHSYRLARCQEVLAEGRSILACVDRSGQVRRLPDFLRQLGPTAD